MTYLYVRLGKINPKEWTPGADESRRVHIVQLCPRPKNTMKEVACSVSHTSAIRNIFYRVPPAVLSRDYGIVLEDDMRFIFKIDFDALVASAPKDWGLLQVLKYFDSRHQVILNK